MTRRGWWDAPYYKIAVPVPLKVVPINFIDLSDRIGMRVVAFQRTRFASTDRIRINGVPVDYYSSPRQDAPGHNQAWTTFGWRCTECNKVFVVGAPEDLHHECTGHE